MVLLKYSVNFRFMNCCILVLIKFCWEQINLTCGIFRNSISCFFDREIVFYEFDSPLNALSFWQKLLMDFILIHTLKSPDLCFNRVYQRRSLWISSIVLCRDWDLWACLYLHQMVLACCVLRFSADFIGLQLWFWCFECLPLAAPPPALFQLAASHLLWAGKPDHGAY